MTLPDGDGRAVTLEGIKVKEGGRIVAGKCSKLTCTTDERGKTWENITIKEGGGIADGNSSK